LSGLKREAEEEEGMHMWGQAFPVASPTTILFRGPKIRPLMFSTLLLQFCSLFSVPQKKLDERKSARCLVSLRTVCNKNLMSDLPKPNLLSGTRSFNALI
jgi:hypothetical protein